MRRPVRRACSLGAWAIALALTHAAGAHADQLVHCAGRAFRVDPASGALRLVAAIDAPPGERGRLSVASVHPTGRRVHSIEASYALSPSGTVLLDGLGGFTAIDQAADPLGRFLFRYWQDGQFFRGLRTYRLDPRTGRPLGQAVEHDGYAAVGLSVDTGGRFLYGTVAAGIAGWGIDQASGALTPLPGSPFPGTGIDSAVKPSGGYLYVSGAGGLSSFAIDPGTGAITPVTTVAAPPGALVSDPASRFLYVASYGSQAWADVWGFALDAGGGLSPVGTVPLLTGVSHLAVEGSGRFLYTKVDSGGSGSLYGYRIEPSGTLTPLSGFPVAADPGELAAGPAPHGPGDFTDDGLADVVWHNENTGASLIWHMNGSVLQASTPTSPAAVADTSWTIVGAHDFNADWRTDLLWRHALSGETVVWYMSGPVLASGTFLTGYAVPPPWDVVATGDFWGSHQGAYDGKPDLLTQFPNGDVAIWCLDGASVTCGQYTSPSTVADPDWRIVGAGDFSGDARADYLWRHERSGQLAVWYMQYHTLLGGTLLTPSAIADTSWRVVAVADYNGDYWPDIVWRHTASSQNVVWYMNGTTLASGTFTTPSAFGDPSWRIVGPR